MQTHRPIAFLRCGSIGERSVGTVSVVESRGVQITADMSRVDIAETQAIDFPV